MVDEDQEEQDGGLRQRRRRDDLVLGYGRGLGHRAVAQGQNVPHARGDPEDEAPALLADVLRGRRRPLDKVLQEGLQEARRVLRGEEQAPEPGLKGGLVRHQGRREEDDQHAHGFVVEAVGSVPEFDGSTAFTKVLKNSGG